jgi:prepilin-type N-terminal cleavage/methylation domain-containing protein
MKCPTLTRKNISGFTLIELSIVLVIVGMLIGLGANMIGPLTNYAKVRKTHEIMDADIQAVISWASSNTRLPLLTEFRTSVASNQNDGWGQPFAFIADFDLTATATKNAICGRNSTFLNISTIDPKVMVRNVAFALLSHADNTGFSSKLNASLITSASSTAAGALQTISATGPNADLIRWVTLDELRSKIGCQGAQLKIVNNELPFGNYSAPYSATIVPDGGTGSFEWRIKKGVTATMPIGMLLQGAMLTFANTSTTSWVPADTLNISGAPHPQGSYNFTVTVRDSNANSASKIFVLTINPKN